MILRYWLDLMWTTFNLPSPFWALYAKAFVYINIAYLYSMLINVYIYQSLAVVEYHLANEGAASLVMSHLSTLLIGQLGLLIGSMCRQMSDIIGWLMVRHGDICCFHEDMIVPMTSRTSKVKRHWHACPEPQRTQVAALCSL